jgi:hypothetical protein
MDASSVSAAKEAAAKASFEALSSTPAAPERPADEKPDTMGFELALQLQDIRSEGFEAAVAAAADSAGGALLFDMPMPAETDCRRVAAVAIGSGEDRLLMLVTQPNDEEALRVEAVEESSHPVAGIVAAYAGLMDRLRVAA